MDDLENSCKNMLDNVVVHGGFTKFVRVCGKQFVESKEFNGVLHMLWEVKDVKKNTRLMLCTNPAIFGHNTFERGGLEIWRFMVRAGLGQVAPTSKRSSSPMRTGS